jgi:hypothetical protein
MGFGVLTATSGGRDVRPVGERLAATGIGRAFVERDDASREQPASLDATGRTSAPWPEFHVGWMCAVAGVVCAVAVHLLRVDPFQNPDSYAFVALARSLLAGHGLVYREPMFPSVPLYAFRSPGYAAFLALALMLGGVTAAVTLQGALSGVSAALVGDIARQLAGRRAAWIAFTLRLAWLAAWSHAGQLTTESFFEFTMILTVWLAQRAAARRNVAWAASAGVVATVSVLTRPSGVGPVVAMVWWLARRFPRAAIVLVATAVLVWLPWPIRNYERLHTFAPFLTMGGVALWDSHTEQPTIVAWTYMAEHPELGEVGFDRHFTAATIQLIRDDPPGFVRRTARAALEYMGPIRDRRLDTWLHRFALLALLPGLWWAPARARLKLPALVWLAFGVPMIPIVVNLRYRFPAEWCVLIGAATGLDALCQHAGERRAAALAAAGLAACILFTIAVGRP